MKRTVVFVLALGLGASWLLAGPIAQALRQRLAIETEVHQTDLEELDRVRARLEEAWTRVERESSDYLRALRQEESVDTLRLRDEDLRQAEGALLMHLLELQRLRRTLTESQAMIERTRVEIQKLEGDVGVDRDPLSGVWRMVVEPGGQEGYVALTLDGTLVQGTYQLDGGWTGSLRGTLVAGKVRLERIDSQMGFVAIFYGRLRPGPDGPRLEGNWEATQLASGMPSSGSWVAERQREGGGD